MQKKLEDELDQLADEEIEKRLAAAVWVDDKRAAVLRYLEEKKLGREEGGPRFLDVALPVVHQKLGGGLTERLTGFTLQASDRRSRSPNSISGRSSGTTVTGRERSAPSRVEPICQAPKEDVMFKALPVVGLCDRYEPFACLCGGRVH